MNLMIKTHRILALLLTAALLCAVHAPARALTGADAPDRYAAAEAALEGYLAARREDAEALADIAAMFGELDGYAQSKGYLDCLLILRKIAGAAYDAEMILTLTWLEQDREFRAFLEEKRAGGSPLCTAEELQAYARGRNAEYLGRPEEAAGYYRECAGFFDAEARLFALETGQARRLYDEAAARMNAGDLAGAYWTLRQIGDQKNSRDTMAAITAMLGYVPSDGEDNLKPVTGLRAAETGEASVTLTWEASAHAAGYALQYKKQGSTEWIPCGMTDRTEADVPGLEADTGYDFMVTAAIGEIRADGVTVSVKTAAKAARKNETDPGSGASGVIPFSASDLGLDFPFGD